MNERKFANELTKEQLRELKLKYKNRLGEEYNSFVELVVYDVKEGVPFSEAVRDNFKLYARGNSAPEIGWGFH